MPSPLQISHLKEYQQPYMDNESCCQIQNSKNTCIYPEDPLQLGILCFAHLEICCSSGSIHYSGVGFLRYKNYPEISGLTYPGLQQKLKKMSIQKCIYKLLLPTFSAVNQERLWWWLEICNTAIWEDVIYLFVSSQDVGYP